MIIKECYEAMGENYNEVLARLQLEKLIVKYALKFLDDPNYGMLVEAWKEKDYEAAYRASHTLKVICSNLGFSKLGSMSANLADALKENKIEQAEAIFPEIEGIYSNMISVLTEFQKTL
ncbi:Hpt domain-containing protein [Amedibacterium intestinale]|uniref:Hpt domain-containing protein n=1 Tax=Amedibacterium intestinale TaxID=2583452 RepID=UPI003990E866